MWQRLTCLSIYLKCDNWFTLRVTGPWEHSAVLPSVHFLLCTCNVKGDLIPRTGMSCLLRDFERLFKTHTNFVTEMLTKIIPLTLK